MKRIDRLGWTAGLVFEAYGVRVGIRSNDASISDRLVRSLPPGWKAVDTTSFDSLFSVWLGGEAKGRGRRRFHLLYEGVQLRERTLDLDRLFESLETSLLLTVSLQTDSFVFVHAGVVECGGFALLLPGRSGVGKTTLVEALVRAGATYYSDEMAVLDSAGRVLPFSRALRVRTAEGRTQIEPSELGGRIGHSPIPLGTVIVASYSAGVGWRPAELTSARCLMALFDNTVAASRDPERVLDVLESAVAGVTGLKGRRGEADTVAEAIIRTALVKSHGSLVGPAAVVSPQSFDGLGEEVGYA